MPADSYGPIHTECNHTGGHGPPYENCWSLIPAPPDP